MNDISECEVGDKIVGFNNLVSVVIELDDDNFYDDLYAYNRTTGSCVPFPKVFARPASADDIARHQKRQLSTWLNNVKWMERSIPHLQRIKLAVEDHEGVALSVARECGKGGE